MPSLSENPGLPIGSEGHDRAEAIPFLALMPTYGGTLAAVRALGARGIPVTVAGHEWLAAARWSRYATRWLTCPPVRDKERLLEWLLAFGRREPRHVLYAPSDDLAFLFSAHLDQLEKYFYLYQPSITTMVDMLDKKKLLEACRSVGLEGLETWSPDNEGEVARIAAEASFPVLLKVRTQVRQVRQNKGIVVEDPASLLGAYRQFLTSHEYRPGLEPYFGDVSRPMIQRYLPDSAAGVYSLTGFIDRSGALSATRAAVKIFQRTRPVGLGLCFESAQVEPALAAGVLRLCRKLGHFGVFEVEFLREGNRAMVIDMNPRFYGQMGFDAARGLPLALSAYFAAIGDTAALRAELTSAERTTDGATIYTHRFVFELLLALERASRSMSGAEYARWRAWYRANRHTAVDASADPIDWAPGVVHAAAELLPGFRVLYRKLGLLKQAS
jgi:D-aspartate ligase